jgi:7-carboxy-7-deazaguanine synthase
MSLLFDVCEIYETLMGESGGMGWPCTLIRMGGCNLNCTYCDTRYARHEHQKVALQGILDEVRNPYPHHVLVTGGEPLIQKGMPKLLESLTDRGHKLYLETNGSLDVRHIDPRVVKVMDLKTPSSGEEKKNLYKNLKHLNPRDEIKFVIADQRDFLWAKKILERYPIQKLATVLFSPVYGLLGPGRLAEWILEEELEVRFQVQLHKILWGEKRGV